MKRCEVCNDIFMTNKEHKENEIIECFVCGATYEIVKEWKTLNRKDGSKLVGNTSVLRLIK